MTKIKDAGEEFLDGGCPAMRDALTLTGNVPGED
jgi:hypothetical protein